MRVVDAIGGLFALMVGIAALSLIVAPQSRFPQAVQAITDGFARDIQAAKAT